MKQITDRDIKEINKTLTELEFYTPADRTTLLLAVVQSMAIDLENSNNKDSLNLAAMLGLEYLAIEFKKKNRKLHRLVRLLVASVGNNYDKIDMLSKLEKDVLTYIIEHKAIILENEQYYLRQNAHYRYLLKYLKAL